MTKDQQSDLDKYQTRIVDWAIRCFGLDHVNDKQIRGLRLLEEAIEFAQSVGVPIEKSQKLVEYVYSRPAGIPEQELGGVAVTALAAARSLNNTLESIMLTEIERVESKSPEHFANRNKEKCEVGFK